MFADCSSAILTNPASAHYGVAVADVDADGKPEFVVAGFGSPNRVLKWAGGRLRDAMLPTVADPAGQAVSIAAGDIDGDGREELYVLNTDTFSGAKRVPDRLFKLTPDGHWIDLFALPTNAAVRNLAAGRSVAAIDRRGAGRYGFFVANHGRPMRLYELGPLGAITDLGPPLQLDRITGGRGLLAAPLFGPATDLFCANEQGPNFLFRNRGNGTFEEVASAGKLADATEHARGIAVVDATADGQLSLCWGNWDGPHRLMIRRDDGTWKDRATPGMAFPSAVRTVIAADFDNDGRDEVFFNNLGEPNRLFRVLSAADPDISMLDPGEALNPDGFGTGAAVADIDGDGVLELLVAHGEQNRQPLALYKSRTAAGNGWLRVQPLTRFGAPARGAVVRAECGDRVLVKCVDGGSGYLCQMEPVAHFGLGRELKVQKLTVTWPDGCVLSMADPDANCTYRVPYPRG